MGLRVKEPISKGQHYYSLISYFLWRVNRTKRGRRRSASILLKMTSKISVPLSLLDLLSNLSKTLRDDLDKWAKERGLFRQALMNEIKLWVQEK